MGSRKEWRSKTQKPCARLRDADLMEISVRRSCHGSHVLNDFHPPGVRAKARGLQPRRAPCPSSPSRRSAAGRGVQANMMRLHLSVERDGKPDPDSRTAPLSDARTRAQLSSATNVVLFEQRLVPRLVLLLDVIEQRTTRDTSFRRPRREWLSLTWVLKCPVRLSMRSDRIAT